MPGRIAAQIINVLDFLRHLPCHALWENAVLKSRIDPNW